MNSLGYHFSGELFGGKNLTEKLIQACNVSKVMQFMVSSPRMFQMPSRKTLAEIFAFEKSVGLRPVIHCPYIGTISRDTPNLRDFAKKYILNLYSIRKELYPEGRPLPYVLHTGKPNKEDAEGQTLQNMRGFLLDLQESLQRMKIDKYEIGIETDANKYSVSTRFPALAELVGSLNDPGIGITLDSEHSYASGYYSEDAMGNPYWWSRVKVLHLNAVPEEVMFGSGLDRHSFTPLSESKEGFKFRNLYFEAVQRDIPIILERSDLGVIKTDLEYLKGFTS